MSSSSVVDYFYFAVVDVLCLANSKILVLKFFFKLYILSFFVRIDSYMRDVSFYHNIHKIFGAFKKKSLQDFFFTFCFTVKTVVFYIYFFYIYDCVCVCVCLIVVSMMDVILCFYQPPGLGQCFFFVCYFFPYFLQWNLFSIVKFSFKFNPLHKKSSRFNYLHVFFFFWFCLIWSNWHTCIVVVAFDVVFALSVCCCAIFRVIQA